MQSALRKALTEAVVAFGFSQNRLVNLTERVFFCHVQLLTNLTQAAVMMGVKATLVIARSRERSGPSL